METKQRLRESALAIFGQLLRVTYAQPEITAAAIASLNLSPRAQTRTRFILATAGILCGA